MQFGGLLILLGGTGGFHVFKSTTVFFPVLIVSIVIFAVCLFWGGALVKKSKEGK